MTSPAPSGGSSPLRVGGLALLGVGAVAGLIGIASLVGGGGGESTTAEAPPTSAAAPADPNAPADPDAPPAAPTPDPNAAPAPGTEPAPGAPGAAPAPGAVPVPSFNPTPNAISRPSTSAAPAPTARAVAKMPVRVYNNSTIKGLAARAADDLRAKGWPVESVANYSQGVIPTSTVYYRPGTGEESSAQALGKSVGARVEPRFAGLNDASPGLILIVTNDYKA